MDVRSEHSDPTPVILLTREVRWFRRGSIPSEVVDWFTASGTIGTHEQRLDRYDSTATHDGVGSKQRYTQSYDEKRRLAFEPDVDLAPGLVGCVEAWLKTSTPINRSAEPPPTYDLPVHKDIITRRYLVESSSTDHAGATGCEAELTAVTVGDRQAWTLCFETFGPSHQAADALRAGIEGLLADTPLPDGLAFAGHESCGYPVWLTSLAITG
ncbi:MAG: hypothetical protein ABFR89_05660 [Actinomycetota bacterium]